MTHREAAIIAMREIGFMEEMIQDHQKRADDGFKAAFGEVALRMIDSEIVLRPGQSERDVIEARKAFYSSTYLLSVVDPDGYQKIVQAHIQRAANRLKKN